MYPSSSIKNHGYVLPSTSFFGNYYNDNNHSKVPLEFCNTPSSSSFPLPSPIYIPLEDEAVFCEFFQQQFLSNDHNHNHNNSVGVPHEIPNMESTMEECSNNNGQVATNENDRDDDDHCYFITHVEPENSSPRKILGFDKASKTVDWLLTKSKTAILELLPDQSCSFMGVANSESSTSECEVLSGNGDQSLVKSEDKAKCSHGSSKKKKEKVSKVRKCVDYHHPLAKATRERARERARERTKEKRNNKHGVGGTQDSNFRPFLHQPMAQDMNQLGSWSTYQPMTQVNQGFVGDNSSLLMTSTPSYLFNYHHGSGITHEHEFHDLEIN